MVPGQILSQYHRLSIIQSPTKGREITLGVQKREAEKLIRGPWGHAQSHHHPQAGETQGIGGIIGAQELRSPSRRQNQADISRRCWRLQKRSSSFGDVTQGNEQRRSGPCHSLTSASHGQSQLEDDWNLRKAGDRWPYWAWQRDSRQRIWAHINVGPTEAKKSKLKCQSNLKEHCDQRWSILTFSCFSEFLF